MLPTIKQIREANGGLDNLTDFEIAQHQHQQYKAYVPDFNRFAEMVGVDPGTKWGNRWSAGIDSAQASLAGVGESALDIEGLRGVRLKNSLDARNSRQFARSQGAIMESSQVDGVGSALEYVGGLAVDTAPQMAATLGAGALGTLATGPVGGAAAAGSVGYSFALGDILENQREQTGGRTDVGSASLLAVPYALVDTFTGVGGSLLKLGKGTLPKAGLNLLDKTLDGVQGVKGAALRTGVNVGKTSLIEGTGETFQEGMNQLGRMAVDPNETFLNDRSAEAFKESFIGGAALGGALGGATGGWRRSEGYQAPIDENGGVNLLNGQPLNPLVPRPAGPQLGYDPVAGNDRLITFPDGTTAFPEDVPERRAQLAAQDHPGFVERTAEYPEVPLVSLEQAALAEDKAKIEAAQAVQTEAKDLGIKGKGISLYQQLKQALDDDIISEAEFRDQRVQLGAKGNTDVARFLKGAYAASEARSVTQATAAQEQAGLVESLKVQAAAQPEGVDPLEQDIQAALAAQSGAPTTQTPTRPNWSEAPGAIAGIAPDKTKEIGRSGRKSNMTPVQVMKKIKAANPLDKMRILAATGMDMVADPTTGAPKLVIAGNPMTFQEIADAEAEQTGKQVSRQAISQALAKFGVNESVATQVASTGNGEVYTEADLGIAPTGEGGADASGFRIEDAASKATNQGVIYDEVTGSADLTKVANALLKGTMTPEAAAQAVEGKTTKTTAAQDTKRENAVTTAVEMPTTDTTKSDTVVTDLRDLTDATIEQNIRDLLDGHPERDNATADWGSTKVPWDTLPDTFRADWIEQYGEIVDRFDGDLNQAAFRLLDAIQANIEDSYSDYIKYKGQQAPTGASPEALPGGESRVGMVAGAEEARPAIRGEGPAQAGRVEGPAAEPVENTSAEDQRVAQENAAKAKVVVKKKRTIQKPVEAGVQAEPAVAKPATEVVRTGPQMSVVGSAGSATVRSVQAEIAELMPVNRDKVTVVQSISQLPAHAQRSLAEEGPQGKKVQAFVLNGRAYIVADNIKPGTTRSVFLHEVGVHMGLENLLSGKEFLRLAGKIRSWADMNGSSLEAQIARRAVNRVANAQTQDEQVLSELVAYFVEEAVNAGVDPTAGGHQSEIGRWMRSLITALKAGLAKLGLVNAKGLTAQDVVDMAYGAAQLEMQSDMRADDGSGAAQLSVAQQLGPQYAKAETALTRAIGDLKTAAVKYGAFTRDLIDQAAKLMPAARKYLEHYEAVATDRTRMEQRVDAVLERFATLNTHERTRVNEVIRTSTMSKEWAFKPDWLKNAKYDENSDVARAFRALTPAQRGVIQDVFHHGHETLEAMQKAVKDNVNSEFDVLIKGFKDAGNMDEATKAEARKAKALTEFSSMLEMNGNWPYAPLRRFGDHVVVAKSAAYRAAELADDKAKIKALEADENHYYVEFFESRGEARKKVADMQATGKYAGGEVENFNKGNANEQLYGGRDVFNAFRRLRGLVNETGGASLSEPADVTINKLMNDLYLSLLGERSARQAERNRKNTAGADRDMMRAFATKGRADAHFIASLRFGGQVQEDLLKMKKEADEGPNGGTRELRREYFNEILARHTMQMDFQSTPVVDKVMATSSFWQLLFNPAYYLQNVMQPWVMSLPMLAGKHGYGKSWSALARAYRDLGPLIKDGAFTKGDYDALPADVRAIVKDLAARGRIEITLEHDLGQWNSNVDDKAHNRAFTWVTKGLRSVNSRLEMLNRLATGIAAARLEGVGNAKNATDYADRVIIGTHGDYNAFNAPRLMRTPLGRMATQFRKFQLIQITMYTKLVADALKGASPDERAVARRVLAYNLGHMAVLGGAMGLPGFQLFSMVLGSIFGDDDEPDDAEATLRRIMGNGPVTDALTRGVPNAFGVDLSGKVGSGNMLSLFPYADWDIESRSGYQNLLAAAAGPFVGGLMPKWADAVGTAKQGDYYKALEKVLPGALGNAIKGTRFAVDGVTTTRGVQAMSADEITWVDGLFQAVGLPTSTITDRNFRSGAEYKASKFFDEKSSQVKKDYVEAFQDNDTDAMAEARQEWLDMQATRKRLGLTVQPLSQLIKAPRERMKRDRMAVGGVAADKETQGFVKNLME